MAAQAFAGPDGLAENTDDVFASVGTMVLGQHARQVPGARRAHLGDRLDADDDPAADAHRAQHVACTARCPRCSPRSARRYKTPLLNTVIFGVISIAWYVGLTIVSQNILYDSIASLGLMIAFYLGITGYAVPIFYRRTVFKSAQELPHAVPGAGARRRQPDLRRS